MKQLLETLFATYYKDIYTYLYHLSQDASVSEDLTSEVFLEVVKSITSFRGESDIKTWLFSIARFKWYAYLRKKKRQVPQEIFYEFYEPQEDLEKNPEWKYQAKELKERIYALLEKEPERTKNIVLMRLEGYSFYEIGQTYHISENSARVIDFRAKAKIREILKKEGFDNEN